MVDHRKEKLLHDWIRDMPFESYPNNRTYQEKISHIIKRERGGCTEKHYLLGTLLENMGINVFYLNYPFYWRDLKIAYPSQLRKLAEAMPVQNHLAIMAEIDGKTMFLDTTWDSPLAKAGFTVNEFNNNAKNAVAPCRECLVYPSIREREANSKGRIENLKTDGDIVNEFYAALNQWLKEIRQQ